MVKNSKFGIYRLTRPLGHSLEYQVWKGDYEKMLKIGDFSKLSHLTIKALRFYEKKAF